MRAEQQRRRLGPRRAKKRGVVAGGVDLGLETGGCRSVEKPCACLEMGLAERRAGYTAFDRAADRCQSIEVRAEPIRVD